MIPRGQRRMDRTVSTRRDIFRTGLALGVGAGLPRSAADEPPGLILRNRRPLDAETPTSAFDRFLTPNDLFFVRSHFGPPDVTLRPWRLEVEGEVGRPLSLGLDDLKGLEVVTRPALVQCSGNGRSFHAPIIPGVGWGRGAVGNAEWSGVRLRDLLGRAGLKSSAKHIHMHGADRPPNPKTPAFLRSIPVGRALDPETLVAWSMNGEPIPAMHGGPLRLIIPGWMAQNWTKWLRRITASTTEAPGFYMRTAYRMPKIPAPPEVVLKPEDLVPVTAMNVKSLFARPAAGERLSTGLNVAKGVAWTGDGVVSTVEISADHGPWRPATFDSPAVAGTWRTWHCQWRAERPGRASLAVRATDSAGQTQPERTPWNKSGYMWNGIDRVDVEVS